MLQSLLFNHIDRLKILFQTHASCSRMLQDWSCLFLSGWSLHSLPCEELCAAWLLCVLTFWFLAALIQIFLSFTVVFIWWVALWVLKNFSDAHSLIMSLLTEFWLLLQSALTVAAFSVFSFAVCCESWDTHSWSNSSCQISCVWIRTVSVSHSNTNQAEKWMSLSSTLRLKLHDKYQITALWANADLMIAL